MAAEQTKTVKLSEVLDSVKSFLGYYLRNIKLVLLLVMITTGISLTYYFIQKPAYEGAVTFILEEKSGGMSSGLSGLASQFGFDIGGMSGSSGMFAGDNIIDILKSRSIIEKVLLSKVDSAKGAGSETLADLYLEKSRLKRKWQGKAPELANINFGNLAGDKEHTLLQDSILFVIFDNVTKKNLTVDRLNKKGSIIKISTISPSQVFSKIFSERLLIETRKLYIDVKTSTSNANVLRLEERVDSLEHVLNIKSYQSASAQLVDANTAFKAAAVPGELSQRDKTINFAIYTEVVKNLEASRMSLANQTPAIQLLDYSRYPLENRKKEMMLLLIGGIFAGIVISFVLAMFTYTSPKK